MSYFFLKWNISWFLSSISSWDPPGMCFTAWDLWDSSSNIFRTHTATNCVIFLRKSTNHLVLNYEKIKMCPFVFKPGGQKSSSVLNSDIHPSLLLPWKGSQLDLSYVRRTLLVRMLAKLVISAPLLENMTTVQNRKGLDDKMELDQWIQLRTLLVYWY